MRTRSLTLAVGLLSGTVACFAGERVCFKNGFCLRADSHTQTADVLSVRVGAGSIDFPFSDVASIEASDHPNDAKTMVLALSKPADGTQLALSDAAQAQGLPDELLRSVAKVESGARQEAVSSKGAIGLMQIMPATARGLGIDPAKLRENALGGAKYLRALLLQYHGNTALALAAYNAGPGAVQRYSGVPPFSETRKYVVSVTREYDRQRAKSTAKQEARATFKAHKPPDAAPNKRGTQWTSPQPASLCARVLQKLQRHRLAPAV